MITSNKTLGKVALATSAVMMTVGLINSFQAAAQSGCTRYMFIIEGVYSCGGSGGTCCPTVIIKP